MSTPYASGDNYAITLEGSHAVAKVWRRPDLDSATGARNANELAAHVRQLTPRLASFILDVREAPAVAGPKTVDTMGELLRGFEKAGVRNAIVLSADPMQGLQFRRLVATYAPTTGKAVLSFAEADAHVVPPPRSRR